MSDAINVSVTGGETSGDTASYFGDWTYHPYYPYTTTWTYTNIVYMYQVKCPKRACKTMNWMQLNTVTPCKGCGAKLRAIKEEDQSDFDIPVG